MILIRDQDTVQLQKLSFRHSSRDIKPFPFARKNKNQATQEFASARPRITASFPPHWLAFPDAINEQVILVQPISSALQRHGLNH